MESYLVETQEEEELDEAIDLCFSGKEIPLDDILQMVLKRISAILQEAKEDGAHILPSALMILCVDEAKRACEEGLITQTGLPNAALTLCLAAKQKCLM